MLKRVFNFIKSQQRIPGAGEFVETLSLTLFWFTIANVAMNAGTFYYTTLRYVLPWFDIGKFILAMFLGVIVAFVLTFKFIAPQHLAFPGEDDERQD